MSDRRHAGQGGRMGCLLAVFAGLFPRFALIIFWIARPERMDATFTTFLWPLFGIIFLPFTTLIYVLLWEPRTGVTGSDWLWIAVAVLLDLATGARRRASGAPSPGAAPSDLPPPGSCYGRPSTSDAIYGLVRTGAAG
jgi:hypothetical protein